MAGRSERDARESLPCNKCMAMNGNLYLYTRKDGVQIHWVWNSAEVNRSDCRFRHAAISSMLGGKKRAPPPAYKTHMADVVGDAQQNIAPQLGPFEVLHSCRTRFYEGSKC